jgi:hypothetical protein
MFFSYQIIRHRAGQPGQVLGTGSLYIADLESAKRYVQTVTVPGVVAEPGLEVILRDLRDREIWRGPYLGPGTGPVFLSLSNALPLGYFKLELPDHPAEFGARMFLIFFEEIGKSLL